MKTNKKRKVKVSRINWDHEYLYDIITDNGFIISEPAVFQGSDEQKQKSLYGSRSPLYGTSYEDESAFIERYRCKCGEFKGKIFEGEICPICHKPVEFKDTNIEFTGWISLGDNYIISPFYYNRLSTLIGNQTLHEIITARRVVDIDGNVHIQTPEEMDEAPKHPFFGIGLVEFRKQFNDIMDYFALKKKKKEAELDRIKSEAPSVFCSHIPVYSTFLRPQSITNDTYYFNSIDKHINPIFSLSEKIKDAEEIDKTFILGRIQYHVNALWDVNFDLLNKKEGLIRGQILGGSLNNSSRNVICPDPTLRDDELDLSYHTFLELFKFKIIHYLMKINDISLQKAYSKWQKAYKFDNHVYEIMQYIVKKEKPKVLINRNPTLNYYSMLLMNIRSVKKDITDFTLSVPLSILPGLNADLTNIGVRICGNTY